MVRYRYLVVGDYHLLRRLAEERERFLVVGGGFIGSEIAAALAQAGKRVTMAFLEEGVGARLFPRHLSLFLNDYYRQRGVEVLPERSVARVEKSGDGFTVYFQDGSPVEADVVVAGLGIRPNTELAARAGLPVEDGIVVDPQLRAGHPDVYAAGDAARFFNPALGARIRVEHEDNANTQGHSPTTLRGRLPQ